MKEKSTEVADVSWNSISYTHVEYEKGDFLGMIFALASLLPVFIMVGFATHIYFRRELHTITFALGQLLNEVINFILKHLVKEQRPPSGHSGSLNAYGWPSAHSQFIWFFIVYLALFIYIRSQTNNSFLDNLWKHSMIGISLCIAVVVSYGRVYLIYHTFMQVLWGSAIGATNGGLWFLLTQTVFTPLFPTIVNWKVSEIVLLRDSTLIPNIMLFEYTVSRQESRSRMRKHPNKVQ